MPQGRADESALMPKQSNAHLVQPYIFNLTHLLDIVNRFSVVLLKIFNNSVRFTDMNSMEGLTVEEMADILDIKPTTVRQRLMVAGIRPKTKSPLYDKSALEAIRSVPSKGRPPKAKPEEPAKKNKK